LWEFECKEGRTPYVYRYEDLKNGSKQLIDKGTDRIVV
jgi:hypothetical protein